MYCCIVGKILSIELKTAVIEDRRTKERYTCILDGDEVFDCKVGDEGAFAGHVRNGDYMLRRMEIRKFLDPLYEEDMLRTAGLTTLVAPIDDPFPEMYLRFKAIEAERVEAMSTTPEPPVTEEVQSNG